MKYLLVLLCGLSLIHAAVDQYNVLWTNFLPETTTSYVNTMPIGNGDLCSNIWADNSTGAITVLISKADAWSEAGELIKVGFVTYSFTPNPFSSGSRFRQLLQLANATVRFELGGSSTAAIVGEVYIDAHQNTIVAQFSSPSNQQFNVTVKTEIVRSSQQNVSPAFDCTSYPVSADVVVSDTSGISSSEPTIAWYHRNAQESFVKNTLNQLNLSPLLSQALNPVLNRTIGGVVFGKGLTRTNANTLTSSAAATSFTVGISVVSEVTASLTDYYNLLGKLLTVPTYSNHASYWQTFWSRSYIEVASDFTVSSQYALWRYTQGLQALAPYELKFNGQLFTANRAPNVDYRDWGGLNWWQNSRLSYYNMLPAGDSDFLLSFFQFFLNQLPFTKAKTQLYYNYTDSAFWDEYNSIIGTTHPSSYGCNRAGKTDPPIWYSEDQWNHYNLQGALDLSLFILDHYTWTQDATSLQKYLPIPVAVVNFYSHYWTNTDSNGKIIMYPTQAIETWQCPNYPPSESNCATNDAPTIAGLLSVIPKLLALPTTFTTSDQRTFWTNFLNKVPALPTVGSGSTLALAPCQKCPPTTSNVENAELYPVHPYRLYTVAKLGANSTALKPALVAFANKRFTSDEGWNQNAMDAALLGLASQAQNYVHQRAAMAPADGYRFPAFSPHLQDYQPSLDQLSVFNTALQYMLMQVADDSSQSIVLLPAWPCAWDVDFKLNGPEKTVIEGNVKSGKLTYTVTPSSRASFVKALTCQ